jgi:hypothetical protein
MAYHYFNGIPLELTGPEILLFSKLKLNVLPTFTVLLTLIA